MTKHVQDKKIFSYFPIVSSLLKTRIYEPILATWRQRFPHNNFHILAQTMSSQSVNENTC